MSTIDEIKQRLDIVEFIQDYVSLQKSGRNFKAVCPFHSEKTPSFFVFPERQSWHCFGACGTGGDIFSFIMKKEGLDFGESLRVLAEKAGVTLTKPVQENKEKLEKNERLYRINEAAAAYYHHLLNSTAGKSAKDYLLKRDLTDKTIEEFQLGFSCDSFEDILNHLLGENYQETEIIIAGLTIARDGGGSYDRFRNRIMFPIRNIEGRVTGFGARALDDSQAKYLNSPQSPIFDKSNSLYAIDRAKADIRQKDFVIITEGYMDVLTSHQNGWINTVASMGTALTNNQMHMLKKITRNLTLALDADIAGEEATKRIADTIDNENYLNIEVKVVVPLHGKDPDDEIRENKELWAEALEKARPIIEFILDSVRSKTNLADPQDKSQAIENILTIILKIDNPTKQDHYVQMLAQKFNISYRVITDELKKLKTLAKKRSSRKMANKTIQVLNAVSSSNPIEEYCLALLLKYPDLRAESEGLSPEYFEYTENREIFLNWRQSSQQEKIESILDTSLHQHLGNLVGKNMPDTLDINEGDRKRDLNNCIIRLQEKWLRNLEAKKAELLAETDGVAEQLAILEKQGIEESRKLKQVFVEQQHSSK
jgi:DNA primase